MFKLFTLFQNILRYGRTGNKNEQLDLQHCCITSWEAKLRVLLLLLATNQVATGCENLLQKVESSSTFCDEIFYMLRVLPAQGKRVLQKVT